MKNNTSKAKQLEKIADRSNKLEKLDLLNDRIDKLKKQKESIIAKYNTKERKNRTRRLIQIGAIAVKYLDCPNDIEPEDFERIIKLSQKEQKGNDKL